LLLLETGQDGTCVPTEAQIFCGSSKQLVPTRQSAFGIEDDEISGKAMSLLLLLAAGQYGMWVPPIVAQALCGSSTQFAPTRQLIMSSEELVMLEELFALGELIAPRLPALEEESSEIGGKSSMSELVQFAKIIVVATMARAEFFFTFLMFFLLCVSL
jgi:hypothetical protein